MDTPTYGRLHLSERDRQAGRQAGRQAFIYACKQLTVWLPLRRIFANLAATLCRALTVCFNQIGKEACRSRLAMPHSRTLSVALCATAFPKSAMTRRNDAHIHSGCNANCSMTQKIRQTADEAPTSIWLSQRRFYQNFHIYIYTRTSPNGTELFLVEEGDSDTGCPRRNVPNFGRVFLMLNYTDITQNT